MRGALLLGLWVFAAALAAPARAAEPCAPWPGEFSPLPTVADPDPLRARWARMRVDQLLQLSLHLENEDRIEANRLWQRALCLDPNNEAAQAGIARTRPRVVVERATQAAADLRQPHELPRAPAPITKSDLAAVDASLARAEGMIHAARFDEALELLRSVRPRLARSGGREPVPYRVRFEMLSATAFIAFGDEDAARASLARALRASPALELDPRTTPPKLLRAFAAARGEVGTPPPVSSRAEATPATADATLP